MSVAINVAVVLLLVSIEGLFVAAEISLVSLRESQVAALAAGSKRGERVARLVSNPNRFLASVQLGVTLTALLSSAFGAVTLSDQAGSALKRAGLGSGVADVVGFLGVTLLITYVTLVIGELAPKRLGLQRAQGLAQAAAGPLDRLARLSRPVIWLLSKSTDLVVRGLGGDPGANREAISEEELRGLVAAHESLSKDERRLIDDVFAAGERQVREVMIPRTEVAFLDVTMRLADAVPAVARQPYSRFPVIDGSPDEVVGFVHVRDLATAAGRADPVGRLTREVMSLPASKKVLAAMSDMRKAGAHLAIIVDEYGGTAGIVTLEDLIEEIIGEIRDEYDVAPASSRRLRGGDTELEGLVNLDEFEKATGVALPEGPYETAAGYVVAQLGHLPRLGESVEVTGARLTVSAMDGRRIERLRLSPLLVGDGPDDRAAAGAQIGEDPADAPLTAAG